MDDDHHTNLQIPAPAFLRVPTVPGVSQEAGGGMPLFRSWQLGRRSPKNTPHPLSPQFQSKNYRGNTSPQAFKRTPRGLAVVALIGGTMSLGVLLSGCQTWEAVTTFFSGAGDAVVEAAPSALEEAATGNWMSAVVGLAVTAVVGGVLELKRRKRKRLRDEGIGDAQA